MRVAAIYDIHGNLTALEAVLADIQRIGVDQIVIGGDVVPGPMSREALDLLVDLDVPHHFIRGNGEREILAWMRGSESATIPEQYRSAMRWVARQLDAEHEKLLAGWPETLRLLVPGIGVVLFCHATPRSDTEVFTRLTPERRLLSIFDAANASVIVCGHTHMPFTRLIGGTQVVNAGSVGMPFGAPGADWLLLGPDVQLRHTDYDLAKAAERIRATDYPQANEFAERNVLRPPSEEEMLAVFSRAELS